MRIRNTNIFDDKKNNNISSWDVAISDLDDDEVWQLQTHNYFVAVLFESSEWAVSPPFSVMTTVTSGEYRAT